MRSIDGEVGQSRRQEKQHLVQPLSLLRRQLSSLCRLCDISLRPEGVFPSRGASGKESSRKKLYYPLDTEQKTSIIVLST